jgi:hypothetical protein
MVYHHFALKNLVILKGLHHIFNQFQPFHGPLLGNIATGPKNRCINEAGGFRMDSSSDKPENPREGP